MLMKSAKWLGMGLLMMVTASHAALAPLEDQSGVVTDVTAHATMDDAAAPVSAPQVEALVEMNLPAKLQQMQQVISQLRGQLEMAQHRIARLEQQQNSGRVSAVKTSPAMAASVPMAATIQPATAEQGAYQVAFDQLQARHYDAALKQFNQYIAQYPAGKYRANVYYWQGEIYLLKGEHAKAVTAFDTVISQFPLSQKVPGAMLKKGMALQLQGKSVLAQQYLQQVLKQYPGSSAAKLASQQLQVVSQQAI